MIYHVECRQSANLPWTKGTSRFSKQRSAHDYRHTVQQVFDEFTPHQYETRVVAERGNLIFNDETPPTL